VTEREETIKDTVRHTEVETEKIPTTDSRFVEDEEVIESRESDRKGEHDGTMIICNGSKKQASPGWWLVRTTATGRKGGWWGHQPRGEKGWAVAHRPQNPLQGRCPPTFPAVYGHSPGDV
jgi:hypothetical protein